jgi:hypothetical protein
VSDIVALTADYEAWLGRAIPVVAEDLHAKHRELSSSEVRFLRGTYYYWLRRAAQLLPELAASASVPLVGDLHVENFGTWRDRDGVQRWGVNDLDELGRGPYAMDLVRLATSCVLTPHVRVADEVVCELLLSSWLAATPAPAVDLAGAHHLRELLPETAETGKYYRGLAAGAPVDPVPAPVVAGIAASVEGAWRPSWHRRQAGTGSLGHPRIVGVDGHTAREAKLLGPPSTEWAEVAGFRDDPELYAAVQQAISGPWPASRVAGWQLRRLAPDVVRIEISAVGEHDAERMLRSMAQAVADVHGVDPAAYAAARADAAARPAGWLRDAVHIMVGDTRAAYADWVAGQRR